MFQWHRINFLEFINRREKCLLINFSEFINKFFRRLSFLLLSFRYYMYLK